MSPRTVSGGCTQVLEGERARRNLHHTDRAPAEFAVARAVRAAALPQIIVELGTRATP